MKKTLTLLAIGLVMLVMAGCTVNKGTGAILVSNRSTKAAKDVKVGKLYIGYVAPGESRTVYFVAEQQAAEISADGFNIESGLKGTIDLKKEMFYDLTLNSTTGREVIECSGIKLGYNGSNGVEGVDFVEMK